MIPYGGASGGPNISEEGFKKLLRWVFGLVGVACVIGGVVAWGTGGNPIGPIIGAIICFFFSWMSKFVGPA